MIISSAHAADAATAPVKATSAATTTTTTQAPTGAPDDSSGSMLGTAFPFAAICLVIYFLLIRPQQKNVRTHEAMIKALRRGDKVVTAGGLIGTIQKLEGDNILVLEIAPEIRVRVLRDTISDVMTKTVANDNKANEE